MVAGQARRPASLSSPDRRQRHAAAAWRCLLGAGVAAALLAGCGPSAKTFHQDRSVRSLRDDDFQVRAGGRADTVLATGPDGHVIELRFASSTDEARTLGRSLHEEHDWHVTTIGSVVVTDHTDPSSDVPVKDLVRISRDLR